MSSFSQNQPRPQAGPPLQSYSLIQGYPDVAAMAQQVKTGDFSGIRTFLTDSRARMDWDDRFVVLAAVAPWADVAALTAACAAEPNDASLHLLLGAYYFDATFKSRGSAQVEATSDEQFTAAYNYATSCFSYLDHATNLDPQDPTAYPFLVRASMLADVFHTKQEVAIPAGVRIAPDFVGLQFSIVTAKSLKWGGSHDECLATARAALKHGKRGDDMPACLFLAHFFVWQYARSFDKNAEQAAAYLKQPNVISELNSVFDPWLDSTYRPSRSSSRYLNHAGIWYYKTLDQPRLRRVFELTGNIPNEDVWKQLGQVEKVFPAALQTAYGRPPQPGADSTKKTGGLFGFLKRPR